MSDTSKKLAVVILAAGKGTRMKSDLPKVLHPLAGRPLIEYPLALATGLAAEITVAVVGHQADMVRQVCSGRPGLFFALQQPQLGTGHAMMAAAPCLAGFAGDVLVLYGDVPGLTLATIQNLLETHRSGGNAMTVLAMDLPDPAHYGRLLVSGGSLERIVEFRDASPQEKAVTLVNSGIYLFDNRALLQGLPQIEPNNDQAEYYLTDLVEILRRSGQKVGYAVCPNPAEVAGVNSVDELKALEAALSGQ